ncbi:MAG: cyclic nucleotide-binding domain-containing protein [Rhizobiaceae bacterium]
MSLEDDIRSLSRVSLFDGFTDEQLRLLAFGAERLRLQAGKQLFAEGDPADSGYVLVAGSVSLGRERGGSRRVLQLLTAPAVLCETALVAESARPNDAMAESACDLIRLNRSQFRRILEEYPALAQRLHDRLAARLASMMDEAAALGARMAD